MPGDANRFLGKVYCAIDCFLYLKVYLVPGSCKVVYYHFLPLSPPSFCVQPPSVGSVEPGL